MSYHSDLWVTTAAAAPVLLLATYVPYLDFTKTRFSKDASPLSKLPKMIEYYAIIIGYLCVLLDEVIFVTSLYSLSSESDAIPPVAIVIMSALAMFGLITIMGIRGLAPLLNELLSVHLEIEQPTRDAAEVQQQNAAAASNQADHTLPPMTPDQQP